MKSLFTTIVLLGLAVSLAGCLSAAEAGDAPALPEGVWTLKSLNGAPPPAGIEVTLEVKDGQASGFSGCNHYFGEYSVGAGSLSFGPLGSTMMACADEAVTQLEFDFLQGLDRVESFRLQAEMLVLAGPDVEMSFSR